MRRLHRTACSGEHGFTIVELAVVVVVLGVLLAVSVPTLLGAREKARDRAAQSALRDGYLTAKTYRTDADSFGAADAATASAYEQLEPSLDFVAGTPGGTGVVGIVAADATEVLLVAVSSSGTWFCIAQTGAGATTLGRSSDVSSPFTSVAACSGGW